MNKIKKILTSICLIAAVLSMMSGVTAYFTAYQRKNINIETGVSLVIEAGDQGINEDSLKQEGYKTISTNKKGWYKSGDTAKLSVNVKEGYIFDGWYLGEDKVLSDANAEYVITGPTVLKAKTATIPYMMSGPLFQEKIPQEIKNIITEIEFVNVIPKEYQEENATTTWDVSHCQNQSVMAWLDGSKMLIGGAGTIYANKDTSYLLAGKDQDGDTAFSILQNILFDGEQFNTSFSEDMSYMFYCCEKLNNIDVSKWDISNVQDMTCTFRNCFGITKLDVSNWDTSSCTTMYGLFAGDYNLEELDVSDWDVSNVKNMYATFQLETKANKGRGAIKVLDVSNWDTSSCEDMSYMFYGCGNLEELDVSKWDVSKNESFNHTFCDNYKLRVLDITNWDTSSVISFNAMFNDCDSFTTIDVSGFNTQNAKSFSQMFDKMDQLEYIIGLENFDTSNGETFGEMFSGCMKLKELDLSSFDTRKANNTYVYKGDAKGMTAMFPTSGNSLEKIILGENFTFEGNGINCTKSYPTPSSGTVWYSTTTGQAYEPKDIPNFTADTYVIKNPNLVAVEENDLP